MFAETCLQWQKQQQKHFHFQLHCLGFENLQKLQEKRSVFSTAIGTKKFAFALCRPNQNRTIQKCEASSLFPRMTLVNVEMKMEMGKRVRGPSLLNSATYRKPKPPKSPQL